MIEIIYGLFVAIALVSALMVVLSPHAIHSALYLVVTMVSMAGLFVMMNAQLAAAFQVIVYAGAIVILFLFVIMLLNVGQQWVPPIRTSPTRLFGLILSLAFIAQLAAMFATLGGMGAYSLKDVQSIRIERVAHLLLTDYIYAFEMTSILLLVSVVGAVTLARRFLVQGTVEESGRPGAVEKRVEKREENAWTL